MMREKPIIFSTPMVKAILEEIKTMTRQVIVPQPSKNSLYFEEIATGKRKVTELTAEDILYISLGEIDKKNKIRPKYFVSDKLWVRETFCKLHKDHVIEGKYVYKANVGSDGERVRQEYIKRGYPYQWKSPRFMPREAARIFLEVKTVRVERLQNISVKDAADEGFFSGLLTGEESCRTTGRGEFAEYWDTLNAKRGYSWESNPWVWVYEFIRVSHD